jgi:hypothetical protein
VTGSLYRPALLTIFVIVLLLRLLLCLDVPMGTSDVLRHLGYASHALDTDAGVYTTQAQDYAPEAWTRLWPTHQYFYPPVTILFFNIFTLFGAGIFWVKVVLTLIEVCCAYLFKRQISELAAVLYFSSPVSIWYVSHEGQFEPLQVLFILLAIGAVRSKRWGWAGIALAFSIQVKLFGMLLLPWIAWQLWESRKDAAGALRGIRALTTGAAAGFLLFSFFYWQKPGLLFTPFATPAVYSPFPWAFLDPGRYQWTPFWLVMWNALFTYGILLALIGLAVKELWRERSVVFEVAPAISFWTILKSLSWAQPWYVMTGTPFIACLSGKNKVRIFLLTLVLLQGAGSMVQIAGRSIAPTEVAETRQLMRSCLFRCSF